VGECFFWYRLNEVVLDKIQRAIKRLCVCVIVMAVEAAAASVIDSLKMFRMWLNGTENIQQFLQSAKAVKPVF